MNEGVKMAVGKERSSIPTLSHKKFFVSKLNTIGECIVSFNGDEYNTHTHTHPHILKYE
jgi:hypothetical protein